MEFTDFFDWKYVNTNQLEELERIFDGDEIKKLLKEYFQISYQNQQLNEIAINFHYYNYSFCKEKAFNLRQTSTFMSIMAYVLDRDMLIVSTNSPIQESMEILQKLLMKHSVNRSPHSVDIFSRNDADSALTFVIENYYGNFELYRFAFAKYKRILINQVGPYGVEYIASHKILPLHQAIESSLPS